MKTVLGGIATTMLLFGPGLTVADTPAQAARTATADATVGGPGIDVDRAKLDALVPVWEQALEDLRVPGLSVAVVRGDEVLLARGFGTRDPERDLPVDADTMFYMASVTKSFLALTTQILAEEGRLDLDAAVVEYLPHFQLADASATRSVTLRDLLSHAKGLEHPAITQAEAYTGEFDEALYYRLMAEVEATGEFGYSNEHYTLLGRVVEAVTGSSWQALIADRILKPIGLARTTTSASRMYGDGNVAYPLQEFGDTWRPATVRKTDRTMHAAGGMGATANDLATWLRFNLGDGTLDGKRIVSAAGLAETHRPHADVGKDFFIFGREHYGLGWYIGSYAGETMIHHFGGYVGSRAHVSFLPDHDLGVAVLMNSADPTFYVVDWMAATVYSELAGIEGPDVLPRLTEMMDRRRASNRQRLADRAPNPTQAAGGLSLPAERYAGRFHSDDWGTLELEFTDDELRCRWGDLSPEFYSAGKDRFLFAPTPGDRNEGSFEIEHKTVVAVVVTLDDERRVRFVRTGTH